MIDWSKLSLEEFAGFVSEELRKRGITTVLVGGACVTIYSKNRYQSYDLDYITYEDMKKVKKALKEMNFVEKNKYFQHEGCPWFLEFVSPPIVVGNESIRVFNQVETPFGKIELLRPVDSVKDRLASFYYWNDKQSLEQAINICLEQSIDLNEVESWSLQENQVEKFQIFITGLRKLKEENDL
jgi:hypothetical protein